jgi:CarD family transcriptional regulator
MFRKGDLVLYGENGICEIGDISTVDIPGIDKERLFYFLYPKENNAKIYVPVDGDTSKMRKLLSKEEALELLKSIPDMEPLKIRDKRKPEDTYKIAVNKGDRRELIKLIKCIYLRNKEREKEGKKITTIDERYMKKAEGLLYQELGSVLEIPKDQVLEHIIKVIEEKK